MIKIKLKEFAQKYNKNITNLTNETGLNRNTITALYHNQVNGIKFDTLETLYNTYHLEINDILELKTDPSLLKEKIYIQEGEIVPFFIWPGLKAINSMPTEYFKVPFDKMRVYAKKKHLIGYWNENNMNEVADWVYNRYVAKNELKKIYLIFQEYKQKMETLYENCDQQKIIAMDNSELATYFDQISETYQKFWQYSIFIDSFDPGYDKKKIKEISKRYKLSPKEIEILTMPSELPFHNERLLMLLKIARGIKKNKKKSKNFDKYLKNFIEFDLEVEKYKKQFDYHKTNYAKVCHITDKEIMTEIKTFLNNEKLLKDEFDKLNNFNTKNKKIIEKTLRRHGLKDNPLYFFQKLTAWRDERITINLIGIHLLDAVLNALETKSGISKKYLHFLTFEEVGYLLKGFINPALLKMRMKEGVFVIFENNAHKTFLGQEAESLHNEANQRFQSETSFQNILSGQMASQGYAKGKAKIIINNKDFKKIGLGDIIVTSMTRMDFLPTLKQAAGIITNEGGITSEAATLARELNIPCIIGTQIATHKIKDGDLVEIRANHETVRIVNNKNNPEGVFVQKIHPQPLFFGQRRKN